MGSVENTERCAIAREVFIEVVIPLFISFFLTFIFIYLLAAQDLIPTTLSQDEKNTDVTSGTQN